MSKLTVIPQNGVTVFFVYSIIRVKRYIPRLDRPKKDFNY